MARNTSFVIDDHFDGFIRRQVSGGRYNSVSEVVREGLRLLEQREAALQALQQALIEGENSGALAPLRMDKIKQKARARASRA